MSIRHVYIIGSRDDVMNVNVDMCYIGVTNDVKRRWKEHRLAESKIGYWIRKHHWTIEENLDVVYSGPVMTCFFFESVLRSQPNMGLNSATGGWGGYTNYDEESSRKKSEALRGRKITWKEKISASCKINDSRCGSNNGNCAKWSIIDPRGVKYECHDSLVRFCEQYNLQLSVLRKYAGREVPAPLIGGYGGFRETPSCSLERRMNTVGWSIQKMEKDNSDP